MLCLLLLHKHSIEILPATKYYHLRNTAADLPTAICLFFREGPHLHVTAVLVTFSGLLTKTKRLVYRIKRTLISLNNREGLENQIFLKAFVSDGTSYAGRGVSTVRSCAVFVSPRPQRWQPVFGKVWRWCTFTLVSLHFCLIFSFEFATF